MTALVLYDTTGQWGWLGEIYGIMTANLASHFGTWTAKPVTSYQAGQINQYTATIYVGSTYNEPLPTAFLDDAYATTKPVIWIYDNIWQLTARQAGFATKYGWMWSGFDYSTVGEVDYKGQKLKRYSSNAAGIMNYASPLGSGATVLATAVRSDGSSFPWALRSGNLTYIGENPLVYMSEGDRYLAFCDLLFDALAPGTATRHRALVRLEDNSPGDDPAPIKAAADYLASQGVPFGVQVIPLYLDPTGYYNNGVSQTIHLKDAPNIVSAFKYCLTKGGVLIQHGYTHQYSNVDNPYTGVSGDDAEFFRMILNSDETITYVGPVTEDSASWAQGRYTSALQEMSSAGFAAPNIWTFPNYVASAADYQASASKFPTRAERSLYYFGLLSGTIDATRYAGQFFPYTVKDVYNTKVLADSLGGIEPSPFGPFPARPAADIVADGQRTLVVRDGVASFFYHAYDPISNLQQVVQGLKSQGYTFVSPTAL